MDQNQQAYQPQSAPQPQVAPQSPVAAQTQAPQASTYPQVPQVQMQPQTVQPQMPCPGQPQGEYQYRQQQGYQYAQPAYASGTDSAHFVSEKDRTLRLIAFIFNVLSAVGMAVLIVPLLWTVPACIRSWNIYKGKRPNTVLFGVLDLLFINLVSGILLLCSKKDA